MADNDIMSSLKGLLGDNADEKIGMVMNALKGNSEKPVDVESDIVVDNSENSSSIGFARNDSDQYISQIKNIIGQMSSTNDSRSNLLMSLRPYMRQNRQKSIDNVVKILNLSKISGLFK